LERFKDEKRILRVSEDKTHVVKITRLWGGKWRVHYRNIRIVNGKMRPVETIPGMGGR
jgi:uncharacterized HAD superfamily protein